MANNLYQVTSSLCIVYKRPSYFGGILALIAKGTIIDVISISSSWAYFRYNGRNAYVNTSNLSEIVPTEPITGSITINYLDESTNTAIATSSVINDLKLGSYSYNSISIKGYSLISSVSQSVTLTEESPNQVINFIYKKILGSVTIKYINQSLKTELLPSESYSNLELGIYSYNAKSISGFSLISNNAISIELTDSNPNQTITFEYNEILGSVIVKYLDKDTSAEVLASETFSNLKLGSYTYTAKTLDNYNISGQTSQTITLSSTSPNQTVIFSYSKVLGSVTIKYVDATSLAEIEISKVITGLTLGTYSYNSIAVSAYTITGDSTQSVTLTKTTPNATITFKYNKNLGSVTVKYLDNTSKLSIADAVSYTNLEYRTYTYTGKVISGYNIVGDSSKSVTLSDSNQNSIIIFYYYAILGSVTVKYIDKDNQADILTAETYTNLPLGSYSYNSKAVDAYTLSDDSVKTIALTSTMLNVTVTFKYSKILGSVTINYVDSTTGIALSPSSTISNLALASYSYNAVTIDNYLLVGDVTQSITLTSSNPNQSISFKYSNVEIEIPTDLNINEVPYISTYYIKPVVEPGEEVFIDYYITDYYYKEYMEKYNLKEDNWGDDNWTEEVWNNETFTVTVRVEGQDDKLYTNLKAGDHTVSLGKFTVEGEQKFSILCTDKYGRNSHELFNFFLVKKPVVWNEYVMTEEDLKTYNIKNTDDYEVKKIINLSSLATKNSTTIKTALVEAAKNIIPESKTYVCVIADTTGDGNPDNCWGENQVIYANDYNKNLVLQESTNTRKGIQQLLDDKKVAGYNKVKLLPGIYRIDNLGTIYIPSNFTIDMNGSTLKQNQFTGNKSLMVELNNTFDSHLINGTIEGDYFSHDYIGSTNNSEWVMGISIGGESKYSSYENLIIKNITGYGSGNGISNSPDNKLGYTYLYPKSVGNSFKLGDINRITGLDTSSNNRTTSSLIDISDYSSIGYLSINIYLGYQGLSGETWNIICHFYDANKTFIKSIDSYQYRRIAVPFNSKYIRITLLNASYPTNLSIQYFRIPTHCSFKNITFNNCRCVGMAQSAMKDMLVDKCNFSNCGQSSAKCAYDAEDGWDMMQDCTFKSLNFFNNPLNDFLICAGHNFIVDGQIEGKIDIWERTRSLIVRNCINSSIILQGGGKDSIIRHGVYRVYNNSFISGSVNNNLSKYNTCTNSLNGVIYNSKLGGVGNGTYKNCTIKISKVLLGYIKKISMFNCSFIPDSNFTDRYSLSFSGGHLNDYYFESCNFNGKSILNNHLYFYSGYFINCIFDNTTIAPNVFANSDDIILFKDCTINYKSNNLILYSPHAYSKGTFSQISFENCIINNLDNTTNPLLYALSKPNGFCKFKNCIMNITEIITIFDGYSSNIDYIENFLLEFNNSPLPNKVKLISDSYKSNSNIQINII